MERSKLNVKLKNRKRNIEFRNGQNLKKWILENQTNEYGGERRG